VGSFNTRAYSRDLSYLFQTSLVSFGLIFGARFLSHWIALHSWHNESAQSELIVQDATESGKAS
jgi:hypothetical protein